MTDSRPIGVYDSGIGGLTVLNALRRALPRENFVYFADAANLPYGSKTPAEILNCSSRIVEWFASSHQVKAVVAACHTSSALALPQLRAQFDFPLVGTLEPLTKAIMTQYPKAKLGVIATQASVRNLSHEQALRAAGFEGEILSIACPDFVPEIESGVWNIGAIQASARRYLKTFVEQECEVLIYGCTHYPLVKAILEPCVSPRVTHLDPADFMARELVQQLDRRSALASYPLGGKVRFYASASWESLGAKVERFTGLESVEVSLALPIEKTVRREIASLT